MRFTDNTMETATAASSGVRTHELAQEGPTRDEIFEMLSNERRRCVLYYLQQQSGPTEMRSLVDYVAAWQNDKSISALTPRERTCIYSALHQTHLPKLASAGLIDYDTNKNEIQLRDGAQHAQLYLEYDPGNDITWSTLYLGLSALGGVFAVAYTIDFPPFETVSAGVLVWGLILLFSVSAIANVAHDRQNRRSLNDVFEVK